MIQARRRILAPANRLASNPSTTTPIGGSRTSPLLGADRRASAPADTLQLYHPLSLQTLPPPQARVRASYSGPSGEYNTSHPASAHPSTHPGQGQAFNPPPMSAPPNFQYPEWGNARPTYNQTSPYPQHAQPATHEEEQHHHQQQVAASAE